MRRFSGDPPLPLPCFRCAAEVQAGGQGKLNAGQHSGNEGHREEQCIEQQVHGGFVEGSGGDHESEGQQKGEAHQAQLGNQESRCNVGHPVETASGQQTTQCRSGHEDRYQEPDLVVQIAEEGLEGKDDGQVEDHAAEAGCGNCIGKRSSEVRRPKGKHRGDDEACRRDQYRDRGQTNPFDPVEDPGEVGGEQGVPVRQAVKHGQGAEIGVDTQRELLQGLLVAVQPLFLKPVVDVGTGDQIRGDPPLLETPCHIHGAQPHQVGRVGGNVQIHIPGDDPDMGKHAFQCFQDTCVQLPQFFTQIGEGSGQGECDHALRIHLLLGGGEKLSGEQSVGLQLLGAGESDENNIVALIGAGEEKTPIGVVNLHPLVGQLLPGQRGAVARDESQQKRIELHVVDPLYRMLQHFLDHAPCSTAQDQYRFGLWMQEHGEVDEILDGSDVRNRGGNGRHPIGEEGHLAIPSGDRDVPIDRVLGMDQLQTPPLGADRGEMNPTCQGREQQQGIRDGEENGGAPQASVQGAGPLRRFWPQQNR